MELGDLRCVKFFLCFREEALILVSHLREIAWWFYVRPFLFGLRVVCFWHVQEIGPFRAKDAS